MLRVLHLLAVLVWAGSMLFFSLVLMPALRKALPPIQRQEVIQVVGRRYRVVGWISVSVLLLTGSVMAWDHGVAWDSGFGRILSVKLILVGVMLVLTASHNVVLGSRAAQITSDKQRGERALTVWLARANILVVLGIVLCGVWLTTA